MMPRPKGARPLLLLVPLTVGFFVFARTAWCQGSPPGPLRPDRDAGPETVPAEEHKQSIRVRVNEVTAPVAVRDHAGEMVFDLTENDFHIYDNGVEQKIEHFDLGGDPLSILLVVETSSHIEALLGAVRRAGIVFSETVMGQTAEAGIVGFDDSVDLLEGFTTDVDRVRET